MKKIKKLFLSIIAVSLLLVIGFKGTKSITLEAEEIKDERQLKAVWMSTFVGEAPYENESQFKSHMNNAFEMFEYYGINAVIFHVRTHNNAFYPSEINPLASWWSAVDFDVFDPIAWIIEETHKRGIEFHAWMNPYRVSTDRQVGVLPLANPQSNPDNLIVNGDSVILDPAKEVVREHIYDTIIEFAERYPTADAVHFDDYFYIRNDKEPTTASGRRAEIDKLIEGIHNALSIFNEENNTAIQFGISPTGIYKNGNGIVTYDEDGKPITTGSSTNGFQHYGEYLYADTVKWATEGWIDYLMPQTYWARNHNIASYTYLMDWWDKVFKYLDVNLYSGIGVYMALNSGVYDWGVNMNEMAGQLNLLKTKENVSGYSIYSYKHLLYGYNNTNNKSGEQIRNAYKDSENRRIKVIPEIKSMDPTFIAGIENIKVEDGLLTWDSVSGGKFYYIYQSDDYITYSTDEIVGVVGHTDGKMSFDISKLDGQNFSVRAISRTNHFSPVDEFIPENHVLVEFLLNYNELLPEKQVVETGNTVRKPNDPKRSGYRFLGWYLNDELYQFDMPIYEKIQLVAKWEELEVYNILYHLNGGELRSIGYETRDELLIDFLTDFYTYLDLDISLDTFIHGEGKTEGYDGLYNKEEYFNKLFEEDNKELDPKVKKFINQPEYNKWVPLLDLMAEYTSKGNPSQTGKFWSMPMVVGIARIKPFIQQVNLWSYLGPADTAVIMEIVNRIPKELERVSIVYEFTEQSADIELPVAYLDDYLFLGWYLDEHLEGEAVTSISSSATNDVNLYAKWESLASEKVTVKFDLNYSNLSLPERVINQGDRVGRPTNPVRSGYRFLGWYLNDELFSFDTLINESITLVSKWEEILEVDTVNVDFYLGYDDKYLERLVIEKGTLIPEPSNPKRDKYIFLGWYLNDLLYNFNLPVNEDVLLTAKWEFIYEEVTVYFDLGYDNLWLPNIKLNPGELLDFLYTPERAGYEFLGWHLEEILFDLDTPITENITLKALWKSDGIIKEHTVSFSLGYDDLMLSAEIVLNGGTISQPEKPEREGYLFAGWYYGLMRFDFTKPVYEDYELEAKWNKKINVNNKVETLDGASIRTIVEDNLQRLRFYGRIDSSLIDGEFGFYSIYGEVTSLELMDRIIETGENNTIYINGKDVKKTTVKNVDYKNEFSIVLTGIPEEGFADKVTVIAYAKDKEGNLYLSEKATTRSVLEIAIKMEEANQGISSSQAVIDYALENVYKLNFDPYGDLEISKGIYERDPKQIEKAFYKDWNKKFNTNFNSPTPEEFFASSKEGSTDSDRNNTNLSNTNIYKFFNDPLYKDKWAWFLSYIQEVDYTIHTTGQVEAIKGNGTYRNPNLTTRRNYLYNASHLTHSIYNFFNSTNVKDGYPAIDFQSTVKHHTDNMNKYDRYNKVKDFNDQIYVDVSSTEVFEMGETIKLPEIEDAPSGQKYVYFDGVNYLVPESTYVVTGEVTFEVKLLYITVYSITFYDDEIELLELEDYYITDSGKNLPSLEKEGYNFLGWYEDPSFFGDAIFKINEGETGNRTFYAKWEVEEPYIEITYDLGKFGYHTTSKEELFVEFKKDYKTFYNLSNRLDDFYLNSKLTLPSYMQQIFLDPIYGSKWDWLEDYILIKAEEVNYPYLNELENYNQDFWRLNIDAFFNDTLLTSKETNNKSLNFSILELGNDFWKYTKYNKYERVYLPTEELVSKSAVKSWDPNYEFFGWEDENNKLINDLSDLSFKSHTLKAIWIKRS